MGVWGFCPSLSFWKRGLSLGIVKFQNNRVRRNYLGGKGIDILQHKRITEDSDRPEEWIASTVAARNPGLPFIKNEGLSMIETGESFVAMIEKDPEKFLGEKHYNKYGMSLGFLMKLLDASMRLHTQAHPTREFAEKFMNSNWGKFESYYVLGFRDDEQGYIRLGFQHAPSKSEWKEIIETQDISKMDACFSKIPIKKGDVVYIPGGVPHAIGENVLMVEIMEPSDLVVRCEYEREGISVPKDARFMGRGLDFCLDIFDYTQYTVDDIKEKFFLEEAIVKQDEHFCFRRLVSSDIALSFEVYSLEIKGQQNLQLDERFWVGVCVSGKTKISSEDTEIEVEEGDSFFVSASIREISISADSEKWTEFCLVSNVI